MLYLNDEVIKSILKDDLSIANMAVKKCFELIWHKDFALGGKNASSHGMRLSLDKRLFIAMPGFLGGEYNTAGCKWHGPMLRLENAKRDSNYTLILNDANSGIPYTFMNADTITDHRTAALNSLVAKTIKKQCQNLAIVGPGKINLLFTLDILKHFKDLKRIYVKGRGQKTALNFINTIQKFAPQVEILLTDELKQAVSNADIISINTGFNFEKMADMPIIKSSWIKQEALFLCSAFAYFSDEMLINSIKIADLFSMYEAYANELGSPVYAHLSCIGNRFYDLVATKKIKKDEILEFAQILNTSFKNDKKAVIFSSGGLAVQDIALGCEIYKLAKIQGKGVWI